MPSPSAALAGVLLAAVLAAFDAAAEPAEPTAGQKTPAWILGSLSFGEGGDGNSTRLSVSNALIVKVGEHSEVAVAYDLDLCRLIGLWAGPFGSSGKTASDPGIFTPKSAAAFKTGEIAGLITGRASGAWRDERQTKPGLLPAGQAHFLGFYSNDEHTILKWELSGAEVLELPRYEVVLNGGPYFSRTFRVGPCSQAIQLLIAADPQAGGPIDVPSHVKSDAAVPGLEDKERIMQSTPWVHGEKGEVMVWAAGDPDGSTWRLVNGQLVLEVPALTAAVTFQIAYWPAPKNDPDGRTAPLFIRAPEIDLESLAKGIPFQTAKSTPSK